MGENTHWVHEPAVGAFDMAGGRCLRVVLDIPCEEYHQLCSAVEGFEDSRWC